MHLVLGQVSSSSSSSSGKQHLLQQQLRDAGRRMHGLPAAPPSPAGARGGSAGGTSKKRKDDWKPVVALEALEAKLETAATGPKVAKVAKAAKVAKVEAVKVGDYVVMDGQTTTAGKPRVAVVRKATCQDEFEGASWYYDLEWLHDTDSGVIVHANVQGSKVSLCCHKITDNIDNIHNYMLT